MKKMIFSLVFIVIAVSFCLISSADSLLVNNISHAGTEPVLDAKSVPDSVYGETVVMYIKNPILDDIPMEYLSEFSGSFYTVWKDGKLYFHLTLKDFSEDDRFILYFDLEDSNAEFYSESKTVSVEYVLKNGSVGVVNVENCETSADVEKFVSDVNTVSEVSGNSCTVETVLDFSKLYEGFTFGSGKRIGFDIIVFDKVDGGTVRYVWNDDTGSLTEIPDSLGTLIAGVSSVSDVEQNDTPESDDGNPGTCDADVLLYVFVSIGALIVGTEASCRMKIEK